MTEPTPTMSESIIAISAMADVYFKTALLQRLVARNAITAKDAHEIAAGTAQFCDEIAADQADPHKALAIALSYEVLAGHFPPA